MNSFKKRRYHGIRPFIRDLWFIVTHGPAIWALRQGGIDPKFRERLMLAVTHVNQCRHCSYVHSREALKEGLAPQDIRALLQGEFGDVPEAERPALLYAQHWAETEGAPDPDAQEALEAAYDADTMAHINVTLRLIRTGNYVGNSLDYLLYRISFGRIGRERVE